MIGFHRVGLFQMITSEIIWLRYQDIIFPVNTGGDNPSNQGLSHLSAADKTNFLFHKDPKVV